jgi:hypothetical protein
MELLDRYLQAIRKHLPLRRQDDIIAELKANMESQLEDKESELGRPLTTGEAEDWLRQMGSPVLVASRYQPQKFLIGPTIFPIYWYVIRMACLWASVVYLVMMGVVIPLTSPDGTSVMDALLRLPGVLITVAAWVTAVFAAIEFVTTHYPEQCPSLINPLAPWSPGKLPPLETEMDGRKKPRNFGTAVAEVVFGFLFLVWLLLIPRHPFFLMGPGVYYLDLSPFQLTHVWWTFFWWIVALNVLQLAWRGADLARGAWQRPGRAQHIAVKAFGLIPLGLLLALPGQAYVVLKHPVLDAIRYGGTLDSINRSIHLGLLVTSAIVVLQLSWDVAKVISEAYRRRLTAQ